MAHLIGIINQKGGVGKTTTAVNLGAALALSGRRVLLVDMDPQSNLTTHLGLGAPRREDVEEVIDASQVPEHTIYDVLKGQKKMKEIIIKRSENIDVAPSSLFLSGADLELGGVIGRELLLRNAIKEVEDNYDTVIVDCPPALGLLSLNALAAVESVIVPVQSEYLALHGVRQLLDTIEQVRSVYNPALTVGGVLVCLHDGRKRLARAVYDTIKGYFGDLVFDTVIRTNVSLAEAPATGETIFEYAPKSTGAEDYMAFGQEILHGKKKACVGE
ncbi:MAG: ParA family protein [Candidatus Dadabacteria bacterium]|nr:MAG: ParA family protein [Candidatus Dadabacteria bacterium]